eukprot:scaffold1541_cov256-Pinguiococcus_pyrenoidosus.AAC.43
MPHHHDGVKSDAGARPEREEACQNLRAAASALGLERIVAQEGLGLLVHAALFAHVEQPMGQRMKTGPARHRTAKIRTGDRDSALLKEDARRLRRSFEKRDLLKST